MDRHRGGAALSIRSVTGKPILYVEWGEKLEDLQQFYPDRMTSRILARWRCIVTDRESRADDQ